jgi:hypothetical protein
MYYPVAVPGGLFSIGDSHASQGDSELCGTAIECSLTGTFQLVLHKKNSLSGSSLAELDYPLLETQDEWVLHGFSFANYLAELGPTAQQDIYTKSSIDLALKDAFRKMRAFLMTTKGLSEDEAVSLISIAVDFGVTQVVDAPKSTPSRRACRGTSANCFSRLGPHAEVPVPRRRVFDDLSGSAALHGAGRRLPRRRGCAVRALLRWGALAGAGAVAPRR